MDLREGEQILKVYHHHPTPFVIDVLKVVMGTFPFLLLLFLFQGAMSTKAFVLSHVVLFAVFSLVIVYVSLIFWMDKLVVTNQRIINIDWKYLTIRAEAETFLSEIQDIITEEKGIFAAFWVFDYGTFKVSTAAAKETLIFADAPDPEGIRQFVYHIKK